MTLSALMQKNKNKKPTTIKTVSHGDSGAVLDSSVQLQTIKKNTEK